MRITYLTPNKMFYHVTKSTSNTKEQDKINDHFITTVHTSIKPFVNVPPPTVLQANDDVMDFNEKWSFHTCE